jgi:hypothetical protein
MGEDRFQATFSIEATPAAVWRALADVADGGDTSAVTGEGPAHWWLPGFEASGAVLEAKEGLLLRLRKDRQPCAGTEIVVTLEAEGSGTRVTVVQSGFGALFDIALDALEIGWSHIVADFTLFLRRGVRGERHTMPWATLGCALAETDCGLEVTAVYPQSFGDRAGLRAGDILLSAGGAPVLKRRELETVLRIVREGHEMDATWVRGREKLTARAAI